MEFYSIVFLLFFFSFRFFFFLLLAVHTHLFTFILMQNLNMLILIWTSFHSRLCYLFFVLFASEFRRISFFNNVY